MSDTNDQPRLSVVSGDGERHSVKVRRAKRDDCQHLSVEVCERSGQVFCVKCDIVVDPVQFLIRWAKHKAGEDYQARDVYAYKLEMLQKHQRERDKPAGSRSYKALWEVAEHELAQARAELHWLKKRLGESDPPARDGSA